VTIRRSTVLVLASVACVAAFTVVSNASAGNFDKYRMGCINEEPAVCPVGTVGQPYSLTIYLDRDSDSDPDRGADFDCATYRVSSGVFPPGLAISDEGLVYGTPTQAGHFDFYLTVEYRKTSFCPGKTPSDDRFVIDVNPGAPKLTITTASLPDANVNQAYTSPPLAASGAPVSSWSLAGGTLPAGLTLAPNGVVSGTPTQGGLFGFTVQANATGASDTHQLTLFVLAPLAVQTLFDKTPPEAGLTAKRLVNQPLSTGVKAVGGRGPYTFSSEGELPPGITLDPATGSITGSGTTAGGYAFTVTVTDATGAKASVPWNITILPLLSFARNAKAPAVGHVGSRYHWTFRTTGASKTRTFALRGKRPPGLTLDTATGTLAGTPTRRGTYRITIRVSGDSATVVEKSYTIRIR
jgi:large repetitive protein